MQKSDTLNNNSWLVHTNTTSSYSTYILSLILLDYGGQVAYMETHPYSYDHRFNVLGGKKLYMQLGIPTRIAWKLTR